MLYGIHISKGKRCAEWKHTFTITYDLPLKKVVFFCEVFIWVKTSYTLSSKLSKNHSSKKDLALHFFPSLHISFYKAGKKNPHSEKCHSIPLLRKRPIFFNKTCWKIQGWESWFTYKNHNKMPKWPAFKATLISLSEMSRTIGNECPKSKYKIKENTQCCHWNSGC